MPSPDLIFPLGHGRNGCLESVCNAQPAQVGEARNAYLDALEN